MGTRRGNVNDELSRSVRIKKVKLRRTGLEILEVSMKTIGTRNRAAFVSANFYKKSKFRTFVNFLFSSLLTSLFCPNFYFYFLNLGEKGGTGL